MFIFTDNRLHLGREYVRIFVRGHCYLFKHCETVFLGPDYMSRAGPVCRDDFY